jgi:ABC-type transporter Mla subunit MlaD
MAFLGSAGGAIWHYYGPDPAAPASARDVERLAASLAQVEQEQRRLTETVRALQSGHDQLQRTLAAREQEIQRLLAESSALRATLDATRNAPPTGVHPAHPTGRSPAVSGPKKAVSGPKKKAD